jgi:hypothetical protein
MAALRRRVEELLEDKTLPRWFRRLWHGFYVSAGQTLTKEDMHWLIERLESGKTIEIRRGVRYGR